MRARRTRKRAGKEFVRNLIWVLVAYAPLAAMLAFGANTPLRGVLIGGIFVPVTAAFVTVVVLRADASDEAVLRGDGRMWSEGGHHSGGTYYPGFLDGDGGDGGGDSGGGGWS